MKHPLILSAAVLLAAPLAIGQPRVLIDTSTKGAPIAKSMYGIFFEEINHSGDGGLYAELIQNRGFEEHVVPGGCYYKDGKVYAPQGVMGWNDSRNHNWSMDWDMEGKKYTAWSVESSGCKIEREVREMTAPLHANTPNAMHLTISDATENSTAQLINSGYWGLAVKNGEKYDYRFYLRTADYKGKVIAMVCDNKGKSIGQVELDVTSDGQWTQYTGTLNATSTVNDGTFRLQFSGNGNIDVDYVSLFPRDTFRGRSNGLRRDIAEALEGLNPDFLRWPGGCIVEGITMENRVKWKETIGDPMTRPGEYDCWGYRCTWGLGYHEALLFCEDLGMDCMYVGNLGMACAGRNADFVRTYDDLKPYIDEIRDAIEYAIGDPATNQWAALRAKAGHPEKFPLKYVELGNENWGKYYAVLFNMAYDELKAEYPDLVFINTIAHYDADLKLTPINDMVDSHWYVAPEWFYDQTANLFDDIDRSTLGHTIYVGEYACNEGVGSGNLDAALSECVFMNNMERNGDIVTMTSYAPLISNQNRPDWACNLIWVNSDQTVGRASYYAQQLYAQNRPDYNVRSTMTGCTRPPYAGRIALGTFATTAQFRNVVCKSPFDGHVIYRDDLSQPTGEWSNPVNRGNWVYEDGVLKQTTKDQSTYFTMDRLSFNDVVFEFEAMKTGGDEGFLINIGCNEGDVDHSWRFNIGGWGNTACNLENATGYWGQTVCNSVPMKIENNRWYKIRMMGVDGAIRCYIDDQLICEYYPAGKNSDVLSGRLSIASGYDKEKGEVVVKVVNANSEPLYANVTLNAKNIASHGTITTLRGDKLYWENSFNQPDLITPSVREYDNFAENFAYEFPSYSLTIMRVPAQEANTSLSFPGALFSDMPIELELPLTGVDKSAATLNRLIARAQYGLNIDDMQGASDLKLAVDRARAANTDISRTIETVNAAYDELCVALETFYQLNMNTDYEYTQLIKNPLFASGTSEGWLGSSITVNCNVAEYYNGTFGISQKVNGVPNGYYLLTVQGFYREGIDGAWEAYRDRTEKHYAVLSANDESVPLRSLYSVGELEWSMTGADKLFRKSQTSALNYLLCKVEDGTLTIVLEKEKTINQDWVCFDNFRLFKVGEQAGVEDIATDITDMDPNTSIYDTLGRRVGRVADIDKLLPGVYVAAGRKISVGH